MKAAQRLFAFMRLTKGERFATYLLLASLSAWGFSLGSSLVQ